MKLYLIEAAQSVDYDEYDSMLVVAAGPEDAVKVASEAKCYKESPYLPLDNGKVTATYIGTAASTLKRGEVVIASFNAG